MDLAAAVVTAQADAWAAEGQLRQPYGGGSADLPGVRVMSSGLPFRQWNSADLIAADADLEAVGRWYAARGVAWGIRVPAGIDVAPGRFLSHRHLMGLRPAGFGSPNLSAEPGLEIRRAGRGDARATATVDAAAFGDDPGPVLQWLEPQLADPRWRVYLAYIDGQPVGVATSTMTDDRAGPAVAVSGVGVLQSHRRKGIGAALSARAVTDGLQAGALLAHLSPDTDEAARVYAKLGFSEVPGFDIYVDC